MERRDLFKSALGAIGGFFVLPSLLKSKNVLQKKSKNILQKNDNGLSYEFLSNLKIVRESVRRQLECKSLLRRMLMVENIPEGSVALYKSSVALYKRKSDIAYIWVGNNKRKDGYFDRGQGNEQMVVVPTFEIPSSENSKKHEYAINNEKELENNIKRNEYINKLSDLYIEEEESILFKMLNCVIESNQQHIGNIGYNNFDLCVKNAYHMIEQWNIKVSQIIIHPETINKIDYFKNKNYVDIINIEAQNDLSKMESSLWGHLWTSDITLSKNCPKNTMYLMSGPNQVGVMPIRYDVIIISSQINNKIYLYDYEEIGAAIINNHTVAKIDFN